MVKYTMFLNLNENIFLKKKRGFILIYFVMQIFLSRLKNKIKKINEIKTGL